MTFTNTGYTYGLRSPTYLPPNYKLGELLPVTNSTATATFTIEPNVAVSGYTTNTTDLYDAVKDGWNKPVNLMAYVPNLTTNRPGTITVSQVLDDGTSYDVVCCRRYLPSCYAGWLLCPLTMTVWDSSTLETQALPLKIHVYLPSGAVVATDSSLDSTAAISFYWQQ